MSKDVVTDALTFLVLSLSCKQVQVTNVQVTNVSKCKQVQVTNVSI